jgi:hypothetical protein
MNVIIGSTIVTWTDWVVRWNCQELSLFERLGLLHHGYEIKLAATDIIEKADRFALYLELADQTNLTADSDKRLACKARSILVSQVVKGGNDDLGRLFKVPEYASVVALPLVKFLCSMNSDGHGNWEFRQKFERSESHDHENIRLSEWFMLLLMLMFMEKGKYASPAPVSFGGRSFRDSVILKAFLESPTDFWDAVRHLDSDVFTLDDLRKLVAYSVDIPLNEIHHDPKDLFNWLVSYRMKGECYTGLLGFLKHRLIRGVIGHHQALLIMAAMIQEQRYDKKARDNH